MFQSTVLENYLKTSDTVQTESAVYAEWNLNNPDNIQKIGNYRYRPTYSGSPYFLVPMIYDPIDQGGYYTGATDSDVAIESTFDDNDQPMLYISRKEQFKLLYSLEDCFKHNRPRSGINKPLYLGTFGAPYSTAQYITNPSPIDKMTNTQIGNQEYIVNRPRYYMSHKDDIFKYWTSYRSEYGMPTPRPDQVDAQVLRQVDRGVSFTQDGQFYIEDACPFIVYKSVVPTNKIVVKMQTNVGDIDLGNVRYGNEIIPDPLYGDANKTTPVIWKIEKLNDDNSWEEIIYFDETSVRPDGSAIIKSDGYVEVSYGLQIPEEYKSLFIFADTIPNITLLPETAPEGYTYLVKENDHDRGTMYIYFNGGWKSFSPEYSWQISEETINYNSQLVKKPSNPDYFFDINGVPVYREFEWIKGIRIVVKTMNKKDRTFDLIEISPRLAVDVTEYSSSFSLSKTLSDLGNGSLPVGGIFASIGQLQMFDTEFVFNPNNEFDFESKTGSILAKYLEMPIKFLFYNIIKNIDGFDYFIPIKTMYSERFPEINAAGATVDVQLRDFLFYLESKPAPQLLLTDVSLSWAITILLDYAGFTNYTFKRIEGYPEPTIPYFFVEPDQNVATVLQKLAIATQSAMFFDEYNNFVVMSKEYLLPSLDERETNFSLYGQVEGENLPNIINLSSANKAVYNDGQINYTVRYIQRSIGSTKTAQQLDTYKQFVYKPVLLWEVQAREELRTINELPSQNGGYTLGAVPLATDLTSELPYVSNNRIFNNIIDVGENVYWITAYAGYLYANGEVIRYDAMEYTFAGEAGPVWISSNQEYQDYMSRLKFNGKMYPTGNIRIYTKPEYEIIDGIINMRSGVIKEHGRGQFGTFVTSHSAGLINDNYWTNNQNVHGCIMDSSKYLFTTGPYIKYPETTSASSTAGKIQQSPYIDADSFAQSSIRNGVIKNILHEKYATEQEINYHKTTGPSTIQSSALVFNGPKFTDTLKPSSFISYITKDFIDQNDQAIPYKHFGTRMRIIGKIESGTNNSQTPVGGFPIFEGSASSSNLSPTSPEQQVKIYGGSGGIGFGINKETNIGYYYEIVALTADNIDQYTSNNNAGLNTAIILQSPAPTATNNFVKVYTKNQVKFEVGQQVLISGLVDANNPLNTRTLLNGEYVISEVSSDKKSFTYYINSSTIVNTTSNTGGNAYQSVAEETSLANMYFYKVVSDNNGNAIPIRLWRGLAKINTDSGEFLGQNRLAGEDGTTVYDLAVEYINNEAGRRFFLYYNGKKTAVVDDPNPLPEYSNMAVFVRGSSRCMFENVYALANNYSQNSKFTAQTGIAQIFGDDQIDASESLRKYAISGLIQKTYLSGISSVEPPQYQMYFEEFGTILREMAYFNIKYDKAYPALYAKLMKTMNDLKGYAVSGFFAGSYGAEFLIFNCTDFNLNLDDTSGNYLRIMGVAFTQDTTYTLTVDEYFKKKSILSDTEIGTSATIVNPFRVMEEYNKIKNSRIKYGVNNFTAIDSPYIQTNDFAENIFGWIIDKVSVPRKTLGINTFGTDILQLGDIVTIDYKDQQGDGINIISPESTRFIIYNIEYQKSSNEIATTLYLVEI